MQLRLGVVLVISALSLAGCGRFALNNHSLDYKKSQALEPLKFPEGATVRPFTPLYPAPTVDPLAIEHAPKLENESGNRYALPRPKEMQNSAATIKVGEQNYLLKLSAVGSSNTVALFKLDTTFADPAIATEVLTQIYQNWPA